MDTKATRVNTRQHRVSTIPVLAVVWAAIVTLFLAPLAQAYTGDVPVAEDSDANPNIFRTTLTQRSTTSPKPARTAN